MSMKRLLPLALVFLTGCTVISYDRVFPKLAWAWTDQAKEQRRQNREYEAGALIGIHSKQTPSQ
jgi:hypothetical protein